MNAMVIGFMLAIALLACALVWYSTQQRAQKSITALQTTLQQYQLQLVRADEKLQAAQQAQSQLVLDKNKVEEQCREIEQANQRLSLNVRQLETQLQHELKWRAEQGLREQENEKKLHLQFEQLAQRVLDQKSKIMNEQNKQGLDTLLLPLREQIKEFKERVETTHQKETLEMMSLKNEIGKLESLNKRISDEAHNLSQALKGNKKLQGNWGEVILAQVLKESGLREGHEFDTQFVTQDDDGKRRIPDAVIHLPKGRDIVIDAKVSLNDYVAYCASDNANERDTFLKSHSQNLRNHIDALSQKKYEELAEIKTLDFVFLFMPIEAAFMVAVEHDPHLFKEAFDKKIIIVSPTTLLATLRTVESIWSHEKRSINADKIAKEAGALHDKFVTLMGYLDDVEHALNNTQKSFQKAVNNITGHGGIYRKIENLKALGASTKKTLVESASDGVELEPSLLLDRES